MALKRSFIRFPTQVEFGPGKLDEIGQISAAYGKRAYCIIDPFFKNSEPVAKMLESLRSAGLDTVENYNVRPNPRSDDIDPLAKECKETRCELVISLGGGSCLDIGKAVAMLCTNGRSAWDYAALENHKYYEIEIPPLPFIAIPTTAGTGSEGTIYSVVTSPELHRKCSIRSFYLYPTVSLIDPTLMTGIPPLLTALTGIDTFAHAYESYTNKNATLYSMMVSFESMRLFAESIVTCCTQGDDIEARSNMAFASLLGGVAIAHCPCTIPHVLGQNLSGWTDAPHGGSLAASLPAVIRWTLPYGINKLANIARLFNKKLYEINDNQAAYALPYEIDKIFETILPERVTMRTYGLTDEQAPKLAEFIYENYKGDMGNYVRVPTREDIMLMIEQSM